MMLMQKKIILIVDDEREITDVLMEFLNTQGYQAVAAHDGPEALGKFHQIKPDLVLLDLKMPNQNGYDLAMEIKAVSDCEIIIISGYLQQMQGLECAVAAGVHDFFTKPIDLNSLNQRIKMLLSLPKSYSHG